MLVIEFERNRRTVIMDRSSRTIFRILGIAGLVLVALGGGGYLIYRLSSADANRPAPQVQFVEPSNRKVTERGFPLSGISTGLAKDDAVWFATLAIPRGAGDTYQPSSHPCSVDEFGRWDCGTAYVGGAKDSKRSYEVILLKMNGKGVEAFESYDSANPAVKGYPGLPDLPQGAERIGSVEVQRE